MRRTWFVLSLSLLAHGAHAQSDDRRAHAEVTVVSSEGRDEADIESLRVASASGLGRCASRARPVPYAWQVPVTVEVATDGSTTAALAVDPAIAIEPAVTRWHDCVREAIDRVAIDAGPAGRTTLRVQWVPRARAIAHEGGLEGRIPPLPEIRIVMGPVTGGARQAAIRTVVQRHRAQVVYCYEQALTRLPELAGAVTATISIAPDGHVVTTHAVGHGLAEPSVAACIQAAARRWTFPPSSDGSPIEAAAAFGLWYPTS